MLLVVESNSETGSQRCSGNASPKRDTTEIVLLGVSDDVLVERFDVVQSGGSDVLGSESIVGREDDESGLREISVESQIESRDSSDPSTGGKTDYLS